MLSDLRELKKTCKTCPQVMSQTLLENLMQQAEIFGFGANDWLTFFWVCPACQGKVRLEEV